MISLINNAVSDKTLLTLGVVFAFVITWLALHFGSRFLPKDHGREYAVNGALSAGKSRGAGIVLMITLAVTSIIFGKISAELIIYLILMAVEMLTGFLDDASSVSWSEKRKGICDAAVAVVTAIVFVIFNGTDMSFVLGGKVFHMPVIIYVILAIVLIWASINVTNCADGVDGLCGSLTTVSLISFYVLCGIKGTNQAMSPVILFLVGCLMAYLWFNSSPSSILMGDAGSRALGFFLAVAAMKSGSPFIFIPFAIVLGIDGGLGLLKVFLLRHTSVKILMHTTTPIHDHVRKNKGWSDTQTVIRFTAVQIVVSLIFLGIAGF
ncbi:MAG: phospho-N-acetylmuramoyl-pentapeptide-transferase [Lachnospiraceae bacterium]|nr:phospho-N-acetylmuramoyl-pentapeptide-transferase [Lachnospiraceae bacterium]